jgi:hypothetical protein
MTRENDKQTTGHNEKPETWFPESGTKQEGDPGLNDAVHAVEGKQTPDPLKSVASPSPEDIFNDVEALRKVAEHKVQRRVVAVNMTVGKPPDNAYFQCHHDPAQRLGASLLFDKEERDVYFVTPSMMNHPLVVPRLRRATLATTYLWPSGRIILWPVPFTGTGKNKIKCWKTARRAFEIASGLATDLEPLGPRWAQLCWNSELQDYDLAVAEDINMKPIWAADLKLSNSLKLGFRDKTIADENHPYMRQLRGLTE